MATSTQVHFNQYIVNVCIHLLNWVPAMCETLFWALEIQPWAKHKYLLYLWNLCTIRMKSDQLKMNKISNTVFSYSWPAVYHEKYTVPLLYYPLTRLSFHSNSCNLSTCKYSTLGQVEATEKNELGKGARQHCGRWHLCTIWATLEDYGDGFLEEGRRWKNSLSFICRSRLVYWQWHRLPSQLKSAGKVKEVLPHVGRVNLSQTLKMEENGMNNRDRGSPRRKNTVFSGWGADLPCFDWRQAYQSLRRGYTWSQGLLRNY